MKKKGFTLIELVVVMAIIAVLALLIIGAIVVARRAQIRTANLANAQTLQTGLEAAYGRSGSYPTADVSNGDTFAEAAAALGVDLGGGACDGNDGGVVTEIGLAYYILTPQDGTCNAELDPITIGDAPQ